MHSVCMPFSKDEEDGRKWFCGGSDSGKPHTSDDDRVNHPNHYQGLGGLEASDVIWAFTADLTGFEAFCAGNAIKYILRWNHKNGTEDLRKAKWYIDELISARREAEGKSGEHKEEPYDYTE